MIVAPISVVLIRVPAVVTLLRDNLSARTATILYIVERFPNDLVQNPHAWPSASVSWTQRCLQWPSPPQVRRGSFSQTVQVDPLFKSENQNKSERLHSQPRSQRPVWSLKAEAGRGGLLTEELVPGGDE
jgi:hypothetical protein